VDRQDPSSWIIVLLEKELVILPPWLKKMIGRSSTLERNLKKLNWKIHVAKDWWGTKVWRKTTEVTTPFGFKLTSGFHPAYKQMRAGQFEPAETAVILKCLGQVDLFVDIGANLGYYTCMALQNNVPVIAFEPQQQNLQCLLQNLIANNWEDEAEVFPMALSDKAGLLTLYGASGPSASLVKNWAGYSSRFKKIVPVTTLDSILGSRFSEERIFIKIDVEGAEYGVLQGALLSISRSPMPVWLLEVCLHEFHPDEPNPNFLQTFKLFWDNGYEAYTASEKPKLVTQDDVNRWVKEKHSDSGTFNYVFVDADMSIF
jgi:FkbM family methyltransferase